MKRTYYLDTEAASSGRTLWNNLVVGVRGSALDGHEGYKRVSTPEEVACRGRCSFRYNDKAKIEVFADNTLTLGAEDIRDFANAQSDLMKICARKGVPIFRLA